MERQCNRRQSAKARQLNVGQTVLVRDYRWRHPSWAIGRILRKRGNVMYEIQVGSLIWVRHANQLRPTACSIQNEPNQRLDTEILLEESRVPQESHTSPDAAHRSEYARSLLPRRRTNRRRRKVEPLHVNPRLKSYDTRFYGGVLVARLY